MKQIIAPFLCIIFLIGFSEAKSQNKFNSPEELNAFKQKLKNGELTDYDNRDFDCSVLKQKSLLASEDYGDAPDINWSGHFGGSGMDLGRDIVSDATGNIYITGSFSGEITVASITLTSFGIRDGIIAKFNNTGSLVWLTQLSPSSNDEVDAYGICLDESGNIYVTGYYTGDVTFGTVGLTDGAEKNLFYVKVNSSGDILVAGNHGDAGETEIGLKINSDNSGNVYIIGSTDNITGWNHSTIILKFDPSGTLLWEQAHDESFTDIVVYDPSIYFSAVMKNNNDGLIDDDITLELAQGVSRDVFIAKADLNGDFLWGTLPGHDVVGSGSSYGEYIAADENENIYMAGVFSVEVIFGSDTLDTSGHAFIARCSSSGDFLGAGSMTTRDFEDACTDRTGNTYVAHLNYISKFDTDGTELWTEEIGNRPAAIAINPLEKLSTTGNIEGLIFVSQLDTSANEEWLVQADGNTGVGHICGMRTDNSGNVYTYGNASTTMEYFDETVRKGVFICKQDGSGKITWLNQFAGIQMNRGSIGNHLNIDTINQYIYFTMSIDDTLEIPGKKIHIPADGGSVILLKYDLDGNYVWSLQEDFGSHQLDVVPDPTGNIILSGTFSQDSISIGTQSLVSEGDDDGFIAKYDEDGNFLWAVRAGGEYMEYVSLISIDVSGNIYISGEYTSENITVDETDITLEEGEGNILFAKLDPAGAVQWVKSFAATHHAWNDAYSWPTGMISDHKGFTYIKGNHGDSTYFDKILLTSPYSSISKFIAKIDSDGNAVWAKSLNQHTRSFQFDYNQFDLDPEGNVYFGLQVRDTTDFGDDFQYIPSSPSDLCVAKYSSEGNLDWVKAIHGNESSSSFISSVAVYRTENVFVGGDFTSNISVDDVVMTSNNQHGFVFMFDEKIVGFDEVYNRNLREFDIYPNPSDGLVTLISDFNSIEKIDLINVNGQIVRTINVTSANQQIDLSQLAKGLYVIKVRSNKYYKAKKLILE